MTTATVTVDLGYGVATILTSDGRHEGTWSGVTRCGVDALVANDALDGWRFTPGHDWQLAPEQNGFTRELTKEPT